MSSGVAAVVLPVQEEYLSELVAHHDELTTLIFGWQGKKKRPAKKLIGPERRLRKVDYLPFLFRASRTDERPGEALGKASYIALCGFMVHRDQPEYKVHKAFLFDTRVERFTGRNRGDEVGTFYVVAAAQRLDEPIPFEALELLSEKRPLNPRMARGYAVVGLPDKLRPWYDQAVKSWDRLEKAAGLLA